MVDEKKVLKNEKLIGFALNIWCIVRGAGENSSGLTGHSRR